VRGLIDLFIALPFALLPRRRWDDWDLPIQDVAFASSMLTCLGGAALGITGFFAHMATIVRGSEWIAPPLMLPAFLGYVLFTPRGAVSLYLALSGFFRTVSWYVEEPMGDPLLTGIDSVVRRSRATHRTRSERTARERLEGADEPDRRYDGEWAGLPDATYVIVAARRKPGWSKGTWVMTENDGWYTLGEPFDRPTPNGLRTVYPLTLQTTTLDVLRKGVSYELPPLRPPSRNSTASARPRHETPRAKKESE